MNQPLPAFHFQVDWGGTRLGFTEVSGLEVEIQPIEYREGSSPSYSPIKMPGLPKYANITLKRGVMLNDNEFFEWVNTIHGGTVQRRDLTNSLLDETHTPTVTWKVKNAWPVKLTAPKLDAMEGRIAIETLEIAHEGLTVQTD